MSVIILKWFLSIVFIVFIFKENLRLYLYKEKIYLIVAEKNN